MPEDTGTLILLGLPDEIAVEVLCDGHGDALRGVGRRAPAALAGRPALARGAAPAGSGRDRPAARELLQVGRLSHRAAEGAPQGLRRDPRRSTARIRLPSGASCASSRCCRAAMRQLWRISTSPRAGPKVVAAISAYMECRAFYDWSGGLVWAEVLPTTDAGAADIRRVIATHGGHATLIRAEPQVRAAVEVFQPLEAGLERLSRKLKSSLRSGRHPQSRPHVRQFLRRQPRQPCRRTSRPSS